MEKHKVVRDAYIYGYPLVTMDMTRKQETNVRVPDEAHAPMGQLIKLRAYPAVDNRGAAAPNADTLYTMVWLDVSDEPWVFSIPDMGDRFYIMPMLSGFNEVFFVAGSRATGGKAQEYAITGPGWSGSLPEGVTQAESPTALVWILGRVYCSGTPEDYAAVHELQDRFSCVPLSAYGQPYTPPPGVVDETFDMKKAVRKQVNDLPLEEFFGYLAELLKTNPPKPEDAEIVERMAEIGIVPGEDFDRSKLPRLGHRVDPKLALLELVRAMKAKDPVNGWLYWTSNAGAYGTDYEQRAMVTLIGPGLNFPEDAMYPFSEKDADGKKYDGSKHRIRPALRAGPDAAGQGVLVADDVRPGLLLRAEPARPLQPEPARHLRHQRGRLRGPVPPGRITRPGQGGELAARPQGQVHPDAPALLAQDTPPSILDGSWTPPPVKRAAVTGLWLLPWLRGMKAYVYAFPLIMMDLTKEAAAAATAGEITAPVNQFSVMTKYPDASFRAVARTGLDTLFAVAWADLEEEPLVLSVPDTGGRYYVFGIFDMWSNVFASIGKRTTGTAAAHFLIAGPGWQGTPPAGIAETYRSPTRFVWVNGQMQADGPEDCAAVTVLQKQYTLTPLSAWGEEPWSPPAEVPVPEGTDPTPPLERVQKMDAGAFFGRFARLMRDNPPAPADAKMVKTLRAVGIEPGEDFDIAAVDRHTAKGLQRAMGTFGLLQKALKKLKTENGWIVIPENFADYGTDYKTRAGIALIGLGGIWRQDVVYPTAFLDGDGKPLEGANRYLLHFDAGQTPPTNATWSVSMYDPEGYYVPNAIDRYNLAAVDAAHVRRRRLARHLHPGRVAG